MRMRSERIVEAMNIFKNMSDFKKGATYEQIKEYVKEKTGLSVSSLYIAQVKQMCGIIERENYNKAKSDGAKHTIRLTKRILNVLC